LISIVSDCATMKSVEWLAFFWDCWHWNACRRTGLWKWGQWM